MGLDMYLNATRRLMGHIEDPKDTYQKVLEVTGSNNLSTDDAKYMKVDITCAYWRKANAIHKWFVDNVQGGTDDCGEYDVSREQLESLKTICGKILAASSEGNSWVNIATELLPSQGGFFFGSTEYDEYYLEDLRSTIVQIDRILEAPDDWYFSYHSSW